MLVAGVALFGAQQGSAMAAAPELTIDQPLPGLATSGQTPTFSGTTTDTFDPFAVTLFDPVTLDIYKGSSATGTPVQTLTASVPTQETLLEDTWEATPPTPLDQGEYTVVAEQTNAESGLLTSAPVTFTVETRPVVSLLSPADGAVLTSSAPTLTGGAGDASWDEPVTVVVHRGASLSGSVASEQSVPAGGGSWSAAPHLDDGLYTAQATQRDEAGDTGESPAVTFTVDSSPPVVTLSSPGANAILKASDPTISGGAGAAPWDHQSVTVAVHEGASVSGGLVSSETVSVTGGKWSYAVAHLNDGVYTVQAEQSDEGEHTGASAPVTFTVDATPPLVSLDPPATPTNDNTPTFTGGAAIAAWDAHSVTVTIHEGASSAGHPFTSGSAPVIAGSWSYSPAHLPDGTYTAQASQGDEAGHTGMSEAMTFTVDTTKPAVTLTKPASHPPLTVSEPVFSGLAGHANGDQPAVTLKIYEDEHGSPSATPIQEVTSIIPSATHEWTTGSTGPRLANGIYVAVAEQSDEAGNTGESRTTFTINTKSPLVTLATSAFVVHGSGFLSAPTPSFSGSGATEPEDGDTVTVNVYSGTAASGIPVQSVEGALGGSAWTTPAVAALPDGTYTAQAEQADTNPFSQTGVSNTVTFTVDADAPKVTLTAPANGTATTSSTLNLHGAAGIEEGDLPAVTVELYAGPTIAGQAIEAITVQAAEGGWSAVLGGLAPGVYTARAEQSDDVANVGQSQTTTFTVLAAPAAATIAPSPPLASFKWFPSTPQTGEPVTLASSSTPGSSPIASYAWATAGNGVFNRGESTLTTSFSTPGPHVVRLQVTAADGTSSTASETITVSSAPVPLMQPFPVVRMSGSFSASGAKIGLLAALAPVGATVTIRCHGRGCPARSQAFLAKAGAKARSGTVQITFRRFERFLRAGVVLQISVSKAGQIGKFTSFVIHRGKSPSRVDQCLSPAGTTPMACPS